MPEQTRRRLALAAFRRTALYDAAIADWFEREEQFPELLTMRYEKTLPCATARTLTRRQRTTPAWDGTTSSPARRSCRARPLL